VNQREKAIFLTVFSGILWGSSFPAIKIGLEYIDPFMFAFLRFLFVAIFSFLILIFMRKLEIKFVNRRILGLGILNGVSYLLQNVGLTFTGASKSSLLVNLTVVWVVILSWLLLKERFGKKKLLGIILSIIGVFFITTNLNFSELGEGMLLGDILVLSSGLGWSFFIVYNKKYINDVENSFQFMGWIAFMTVIPLIPFISLSSSLSLNYPIEGWIAIVYTAIFCWILPYNFWLKGLAHISSVTSTVILLTEVIVAIIISIFILNEVFTLISSFGALLILLAIMQVSLDK
jgi:drug/metabolite transporter (DMT)-like permease